jgi:6-pyruvoyl-tetrahydropterin synthase
MSNKRYRLISGIAYPDLYQGKNQPIKISSSLSDPQKYYKDKALRLADGDCHEYIGKPIYVEHKTHKPSVGTIVDAWKDTDGHMRILARIYVETRREKKKWNRIESGDLNSLSVGYSVPLNAHGERIQKCHKEISLCRQPFFYGAEIKITANQNSQYINNISGAEGNFFFKIMTDANPQQTPIVVPTATTTAPTATAAPPPPMMMEKKDGAEMMLQYDSLLKRMDEMKKQLDQKAEVEKQLQNYQEREKEARKKFAEERKPVLENFLKETKELYGKDLPEDYVKSMQLAFMSPERESSTAVIVASQQAYRAQRDKAAELETKLNQLTEKMKKFEEQQPFYEAHVKRTNERLALVTSPAAAAPAATEVTVNASGGGKKFYDLFEPSEDERKLYEMQFGRPLDVNINASATGGRSQEPPAPTHPYVEQLPYSMRKQDPVLFNFLTNPSRNWDGSGVVLTKNTTQVSDN